VEKFRWLSSRATLTWRILWLIVSSIYFNNIKILDILQAVFA
jgi:hypothetical protein